MRKRFGLVVLALGVVALARARGWFPVRVDGPSMLPTLEPGDLLAVRPLRDREPHVGQVVVVRRGEIEMVKRVSKVLHDPATGDGEIWLTGDNPGASTDSRTIGPAARRDVAGIVRARYKPLRAMRVF